MATFYESDNSPIASELVRQGFTLDRGEALRIIDIDERASGTNTAIAIGAAAINLVAACGALALSGFTLPILAPIAALGFAGLTAWNSRATKQEREFEAEFLHNHPEFVEAVNQKLEAGEQSDRVAAAYDHTLKAFIEGDAKRMQSFLPVALVPISMAPYPVDESPAIATASPIGNTTRLGAVNVPSSPAAQSGQWDEDEQLMTSTDRYEWMKDLLSYPSVLIYGAPGAGKSTFAEWLVTERAKNGHKLEILDPHRKFGQWDGLSVFGDGMNFNAIDDRLKAFADLVDSRYLGRSKKADFNPRPLTVLAEEFTQWAKKCSHAPAFFEMSVSDIRKINCHVVYVSHGRTLTSLGGSKGLAATRDSALLELELLAKVDETTGEAVPALKGLLKYPGRSPMEVAIPAMKPQKTPVKVAQTFEDDFEISQSTQPEKESSESEQSDARTNIEKPNLSRSDLMLQIGILGEWIDTNPGLSFDQMYANYSARRKGFSRPQFRYLLIQIENLDS